MKAKKYLTPIKRSQKIDPRVEEEGVKYGRKPSRKVGLGPGMSLAQARKRFSKPVKRSAKLIRWAMGIAGIGKGPKDLSENMRAYLRRDK